MKIIGANVTGSFILNGVDVTNTLQSSSIWSGSVASSINSLNSATASLNASTASLYNYTSSNTTNINTLFTASASLNASVTSLNAATASLNTATASLNTATASFSSSIGSLNNSTASLNAVTASLNTATASFSSSIGSLNNATASFSSSIGSLFNATASLNTATSSLNSSITSLNAATASLLSYTASQTALNGTFATTGSNTFFGTQTITGSLFISQNLVVQGSSSVQNITASAVSIGTNTVILNTDTPAVRFGGIKVQDSGSGAGASGSLLWDSLNNHWIYQHPSGGAESGMSARLISGPKNSGSLGNEAGITSGRITVAVGDDHIGDSIMTQTGTVISVAGDLTATSLTGSINGSQITNSTVANAKLANSTISGIALGSNLATLTIGTGLSGTSYNGSTGITIANTITNNNQLTNGAGYITSTGTAAAINQTITAGSEGNLVFATIGTNDFFRIRAGGGSNAGFVEIATADDGTEPIYVRQYTGEFASLTRTATLLDGSGNTSFPGSLSATNLSGTNTGDQTNISGNSATTSQTTFSTLTSTGAITANSGGSYSATLGTIASSWGGNSTYPTLYGSTVDRWVMHMNMHISYTANGVNGFGGSMTGATIRMASDTAATHYWDIGPGTSGVGTDKFSIGRNATSFFSIANGGIAAFSGRIILGTFANSTTNTGEAWIGRASDRNAGTMTVQLGGNSASSRSFEVVDYAWSVVLFSVSSGGTATASGDVVAYSDARVKANIKPIDSSLEKVLKLTGVTYNRTDLEDKSTKIGFIAQEVEKVVPEVVTYDSEKDRYGVSYGNVTALLVEAIKEQQTQIEELKTIINGLTK
jgi:exonuclease VII small subunit